MKSFGKKIKGIFYYKTTFMMIPHSEKSIFSFHLSNLNVFIVSSLFIVLTSFGIFLNFKMKERKEDFEYYYQENIYYKKQIHSIDKMIPNIKKSQSDLSGKLDKVFGLLGVSAEHQLDNESVLDKNITVSVLDNLELKMESIGTYIENFQNLFQKIPSIFPLVTRRYWLTSPFGYRIHPITGRKEMHPALDIAAFPGTPIRATADGFVEFAGWRGGYGNVVYLQHMGGYTGRYAHMLRVIAVKGHTVKKGEIIGYVGSTGVSTGYHLHYELRLNDVPVNPLHYIALERFWR